MSATSAGAVRLPRLTEALHNRADETRNRVDGVQGKVAVRSVW
jgi:hypothetical protein